MELRKFAWILVMVALVGILLVKLFFHESDISGFFLPLFLAFGILLGGKKE